MFKVYRNNMDNPVNIVHIKKIQKFNIYFEHRGNNCMPPLDVALDRQN